MLVVWAVVVAVSPAVAQAQEAAPTSNTAERIVVSPGDSLWSISSEWLGPNATPRQVAIGVERIYTLNRNRIGSDPNLIFVGQRLSLPPVSEPSRAEASGTPPPPTREATKPGEASMREPGPEKEASKTPPNKEAKQVELPDMPTKQPAPKVGSLTATVTPSPVESFVRGARSLFSSATSTVGGLFPQEVHLLGGRRQLGLGIIALTLLIAGLIAWRMPLKRNVGGFEAWVLPRAHAGYYAQATRSDSRIVRDEATEDENGLNGGAGMIVATQRRRHRGLRERVLREQKQGTSRLPHSGLATGAHDPQVTRHLRRARTFTPGRTVARSPRLRQRSLSQKGRR
jgi:hypothetical protein